MKKTTKDGQSIQKQRYNQSVIWRLSEKFGLTKMYIRQCLRGDRDCETADTLKREYKEMVQKIEEVIK